jgi:signal transduction histidine kinase
VRQIVEAHGSMLDVQSAEGRGSTFKFPLLAVASEK